MGPFEFIGELCTFDSAYLRGWRWLFSARYREEVRFQCAQHRSVVVVAAVLETLILMLAEVVGLVFLIRCLVSL
jgi:hypothetical protein